MAARIEKRCRCGATFYPRQADVDRGWGKFCSKSCKAVEQEGRTGQSRRFHLRREFGGEPQFDNRGEYVGFTGIYVHGE